MKRHIVIGVVAAMVMATLAILPGCEEQQVKTINPEIYQESQARITTIGDVAGMQTVMITKISYTPKGEPEFYITALLKGGNLRVIGVNNNQETIYSLLDIGDIVRFRDGVIASGKLRSSNEFQIVKKYFQDK